MQSRDFCYWLQGFFELSEEPGAGLTLTPAQVKMIQAHLNLVFTHEIDPSMGDATHQAKLNKIHNNDNSPFKGTYMDPNSPNYDPKARC